jgi:hypothetical protein
MTASNKYSELIRIKLKTHPDQPSLRDVGKSIGYSYEHVRKAMTGLPSASRQFNDALCKYLGLDPDAMWKILIQDLAKRKYGAALEIRPPDEERFQDLWPSLTSADRDCLYSAALAMAIANDATASSS